MEVNEVSGGLVFLIPIVALIGVNLLIWGAVAGKKMCEDGVACVRD